MARMNEGFAKPSPQARDVPDWTLLPIEPRQDTVDRCHLVEANWAPAGPGWFDSSWLLRQGLEVTEIRSASLLENVLKALQMQSPPDENVLHAPA
jgi:hypothetical protein